MTSGLGNKGPSQLQSQGHGGDNWSGLREDGKWRSRRCFSGTSLNIIILFLDVTLNKDFIAFFFFFHYVCTLLVAGTVRNLLIFISSVPSSMPATCQKINKCLLNEYFIVIIRTALNLLLKKNHLKILSCVFITWICFVVLWGIRVSNNQNQKQWYFKIC